MPTLSVRYLTTEMRYLGMHRGHQRHQKIDVTPLRITRTCISGPLAKTRRYTYACEFAAPADAANPYHNKEGVLVISVPIDRAKNKAFKPKDYTFNHDVVDFPHVE